MGPKGYLVFAAESGKDESCSAGAKAGLVAAD
jgi:hypothetical protein